MLLAEMLDGGFKGRFDLLYVPYSVELDCNLGHAIVNFTQPEYAKQFLLSFHGNCLDDKMRTGRSLVFERPHRGMGLPTILL